MCSSDLKTWLELKWLIEGILFAIASIYFVRGILYPGSRIGWGRFGGGKKMSRLSQIVWSLGFLYFSIDSFLLLFHHALPAFGTYVIFSWLGLIFIIILRVKAFDP